jgi:predicted RND superfamily exporter protein
MKSHKINQFFGRYAAFLLRWRWAAIAIFAVILAVSFHGMSKMEQIRSLAYSKPHVARKLISKDGKNAWILVKLRAFPSEDEWKQTATMFPGVTVTAVGNIPQYTTMMQYLVRGQMLSFIISVLIIAVILMIAFQSVRVGRNHSGFSNCLTT